MTEQQRSQIAINHENGLANLKSAKLVLGDAKSSMRLPLTTRDSNQVNHGVTGGKLKLKQPIKPLAQQTAKIETKKEVLPVSEIRAIPSRPLPPHIVDIDAEDVDCLEFSPGYAKDIYDYLFAIENAYPVKTEYLQRHPTLRPHMRMILVEWLVSLQGRFKLLQETLLLTVSILDRFMSETDSEVSRGKFQLVGVSCMLIACKYEEMYLPSVADFAYMCDGAFTTDHILRMERLVLSTLKFEFAKPLSAHFLRRFSKAGGSDSMTHIIAKYFLELALYDYELAHCLPSVIAAAALYIAGKATRVVEWDEIVRYYSRYEVRDIEFVVGRLCRAGATADSNKYFKTTFKKYAADKFQRVARIIVQNGDVLSLAAKE